MKRFLDFFLILVLTGAPANSLGWQMADSSYRGYDALQLQLMPQSHDDEVPDDEDEEKEDDDYD